MSIRILTLSCLLALSCSSQAIAQSATPDNQVARATAQAETINDANKFLAEVDDSLELARNGEYGKLRRSDMGRLEEAQAQIHSLLEGHASATELPPEERIALYNAQEVMTAILRKDEKDRVICQQQVVTGTRLSTTECLTVAQREQRARVSRESTDGVQRNICIAGEGNPCN